MSDRDGILSCQAKLTEIVNNLENKTDDHEKRIRWLERTLVYACGAATIMYFTYKQLI